MKNQLASFILGGFVFISFAATTTSIMSVKPVTPKAAIIVSGWSTSELNTNIKPYLKWGYIVKNVSAGDGARVVVMEKY